MYLEAPFIQLPVRFEADVLAAELASFSEDDWMPHPAGFAGNDFLPLISVRGDPRNEAFEGPMRPTSYLDGRPYMKQVLAAIGGTLGRARLMRLSGHAEVTPHVDVNYYWRDRARVHVPIVTQPTVTFYCGAHQTHMAAGECWIFNTWTLHRVLNDAGQSRVHLVVDTVGGEGFWRLVAAGRVSGAPGLSSWTPRLVKKGEPANPIDYESLNIPTVMSPWELREHLNFLLSEVVAGQPNELQVVTASSFFVECWRGLWAASGDDRAVWPRYRRFITNYVNDLKNARAHELKLANDLSFAQAVGAMLLSVALGDQPRFDQSGERRDRPAAIANV